MDNETDLDDADLLRLHGAGDTEAFAEIVRRHRDRLWVLALRTLGNPDDAADVVQDALLSAFRYADTFRGDAQVSTWLHRIVMNACFDRMRRNSARPTSPLPPDADDLLAEDRDDIAATDARLDVRSALRAIPDDQRAAIVLVDVLGHSVSEAAQILSCPEGTVKSRCARGRARLAHILAPTGNQGPESGVSSKDGGEHT